MKLIFLIMALSPLLSFASGGTVENGGDVLMCQRPDNPNAPIVGPMPKNWWERFEYFSRDYIAALMDGYELNDFDQPRNWNESQARINKILAEVSPKLRASFEEFVESTNQIELKNKNLRGERNWIKGTNFPFISRDGERIPNNCLFYRQMGNTLIGFRGYARSVIRTKNNKGIEYKYDVETMQRLLHNSSLQFSFILVHEWLWDHVKKLSKNQRINAFLHSREIDRMTPKEIRRKFKFLGLNP